MSPYIGYIYVISPDVSSNVLRSEPVSLALGSSEVGRVLLLSIHVAPLLVRRLRLLGGFLSLLSQLFP